MSTSFIQKSMMFMAIALSTLSTHASQEVNEMATPTHLTANSPSVFSTQPFEHGVLDYQSHQVIHVMFDSHGTQVVGNLFVPKNTVKGVVVVMGPVAFVKEQSPIQYASRLVKQGFAVLIFDPRYHGESGGEPRRFESRQAKVEDISSAVDFVSQNTHTKGLPVYGLGVCQGVNWVMEAASKDQRIQKIALVAGHYLTPDVANMYVGSAEKVQARVQAAQAAKDLYNRTGEVKYIPIVSETDNQTLLGAPVIRQFYSRWADRGGFWNFHGLWENRITQMSEAEIWGHDLRPIAAALQTPVLVVHADHAASGPNVPKQIFESIPTRNKKLVWLGDRNQMQFYEDPLTIDKVTEDLAAFYK